MSEAKINYTHGWNCRHDRSTSWIIIIARSKDAVRTKIKKESMLNIKLETKIAKHADQNRTV